MDGAVNEAMIDRYYVLVVDSCGIVLDVAGMLPKRIGLLSGCCQADAYKLRVQVALPENYHRFSIMAAKDSTPTFVVQGGRTSGLIVDMQGPGTTSGVSSPTAVPSASTFTVLAAVLRLAS